MPTSASYSPIFARVFFGILILAIIGSTHACRTRKETAWQTQPQEIRDQAERFEADLAPAQRGVLLEMKGGDIFFEETYSNCASREVAYRRALGDSLNCEFRKDLSRELRRIVKPDDADYKDMLARFAKQE